MKMWIFWEKRQFFELTTKKRSSEFLPGKSEIFRLESNISVTGFTTPSDFEPRFTPLEDRDDIQKIHVGIMTESYSTVCRCCPQREIALASINSTNAKMYTQYGFNGLFYLGLKNVQHELWQFLSIKSRGSKCHMSSSPKSDNRRHGFAFSSLLNGTG